MKAARGWRRWWWWWFHPAVVEEAAHGLFHGWCNSRRKEGRRGAWERKRKEGRKRWKKACTHPGHCNCHGVYNCCTLLCSLCGSPLQPSASVTLSLQLAAGHSAVVVVVVVDSRGGWRRGETGEISLRFHGADLNRRKGEREREKEMVKMERKWPCLALFSARNRATFRRPSRCLAAQRVSAPRWTSFFLPADGNYRRACAGCGHLSREIPWNGNEFRGLSLFSPSFLRQKNTLWNAWRMNEWRERWLLPRPFQLFGTRRIYGFLRVLDELE